MKFLLLLFSSAFAIVAGHASTLTSTAAPITETEAKAIIEERMAEKALREANRKAELESMSVADSRVLQKEGHRVTINLVVPPRLEVAPAPTPSDRQASRTWTEEEWAAMIAAQPEHQSISLSVTVFGDEYSKILWRAPRDEDERRKAPEEFEIWTNVNLNYLRPISSFDRDNIVYSYMGFTSTITREDEAWQRVYAKERGYDYESRWESPPVRFTEGKAEYVVVEAEERRIPRELYEQMDALFTHYLENEDRFKAEFLRNEALSKAREAYLKENPPEPKDVIINHWPISEGGAR
tara:strand:+ start:11645 stop:12529 length:885 start_codon:yes stop_codon:yes gene_type:complete